MTFEENFNTFIPELTKALTVPKGRDWSVKGFIDIHKNIYSISNDTKVVSKIIELMIFPKLLIFAKQNDLELKLSPYQNYYPDVTFIDKEGKKYAVDLKSTYRASKDKVNGMTLGAFTGYFRNRESSKNTLYPYGEYHKHYVFGIIYSRTDIRKIEEYIFSLGITMTQIQKKLFVEYINENSDEKWKNILEKINLTPKDRIKIDTFLITEIQIHTLDTFTQIQSVVRDFDFFLQEKWKIATDKAGSGNTKNIGSELNINKLKSGQGLFQREFKMQGQKIFDNYWMNYETKSMAKDVGRDKPQFNNIESYLKWKESLK